MYTYNANISEKLYSNWLELTDDKVLTATQITFNLNKKPV